MPPLFPSVLKSELLKRAETGRTDEKRAILPLREDSQNQQKVKKRAETDGKGRRDEAITPPREGKR